jgi:hypothetical protein
MPSKKHFRQVEKHLLALGYARDHVNSSSQFVYVHPARPDLALNPTLNEHAARQILDNLGCSGPKPSKRNVGAVKARQAKERRRLQEEAARLASTRLRIIAERDALLGGAGSHLTNSEIRDLERRVREIEAQERELATLMTERPAPGPDRAKHRSGQR